MFLGGDCMGHPLHGSAQSDIHLRTVKWQQSHCDGDQCDSPVLSGFLHSSPSGLWALHLDLPCLSCNSPWDSWWQHGEDKRKALSVRSTDLLKPSRSVSPKACTKAWAICTAHTIRRAMASSLLHLGILAVTGLSCSGFNPFGKFILLSHLKHIWREEGLTSRLFPCPVLGLLNPKQPWAVTHLCSRPCSTTGTWAVHRLHVLAATQQWLSPARQPGTRGAGPPWTGGMCY